MNVRMSGPTLAFVAVAMSLLLTGCDGSVELEPTPSFGSSSNGESPIAVPSEPPYETDLNLTGAETDAAEAAYDVLVSFITANNQVMADSENNPDRALVFLDGSPREAHVKDYESMRAEQEVGVGGITHSYHRIDEVLIHEEGEITVAFSSCVDYRYFDIVDRDGESLAGEDTSPVIVVHQLEGKAGDWVINKIDYTGNECEGLE